MKKDFRKIQQPMLFLLTVMKKMATGTFNHNPLRIENTKSDLVQSQNQAVTLHITHS
jgi:hypothetical protein